MSVSTLGSKMVIVNGGGLNFKVAIENAIAKGWGVTGTDVEPKEGEPFPVDQLLSKEFVSLELVRMQ